MKGKKKVVSPKVQERLKALGISRKPSKKPKPERSARPASVEDMNAALNENSRQMANAFAQSLREQGIGVQREAPPAVAAAPTYDDPTDEEVIAAYDSGDARQIAKINMRQRRADQARQTYETDQKIAALRSAGVGPMSKLVARGLTADLKFYKKYKPEIDAIMANASEDARMDPDTWEQVHDLIVGKHVVKGDHKEDVAEAPAQRKQVSSPNGRSSARRAAEVDEDGEVAEERAGIQLNPASRDEIRALRAMGYRGTADEMRDQFAQRLGHKDWRSYKLKGELEEDAYYDNLSPEELKELEDAIDADDGDEEDEDEEDEDDEEDGE